MAWQKFHAEKQPRKRSTTMGDKGGKKNKAKSQKQSNDKNRQKAKEKLKKQQKGQPELILPHQKS